MQQEVAKAAQTLIEFPPMRKGASFNMEAVKEQIQHCIRTLASKLKNINDPCSARRPGFFVNRLRTQTR